MITIKEAIIVEGKYDKIKLSSLVDATIITTNGFAVFTDDAKMDLIRRLAQKQGIIIFTDSDRAGFLIRNYIAGCIEGECVKHAYLPEQKGRERRKRMDSKEGLLGVEGVSRATVLDALHSACPSLTEKQEDGITKADLYVDGLLGRENSAALRRAFLEQLGLPSRVSAAALLRIINAFYTVDEYKTTLNLLKI